MYSDPLTAFPFDVWPFMTASQQGSMIVVLVLAAILIYAAGYEHGGRNAGPHDKNPYL